LNSYREALLSKEELHRLQFNLASEEAEIYKSKEEEAKG
jgi:hypothetical protein